MNQTYPKELTDLNKTLIGSTKAHNLFRPFDKKAIMKNSFLIFFLLISYSLFAQDIIVFGSNYRLMFEENDELFLACHHDPEDESGTVYKFKKNTEEINLCYRGGYASDYMEITDSTSVVVEKRASGPYFFALKTNDCQNIQIPFNPIWSYHDYEGLDGKVLSIEQTSAATTKLFINNVITENQIGKEITGATISPPEFLSVDTAGFLLATNFDQKNIYELDTFGVIKNIYGTPEMYENKYKRGQNYFSASDYSDKEIGLKGIDNKGNLFADVILKLTFDRTNFHYNNFIFTPDNGIFLIGNYFQNRFTLDQNEMPIYADSDLLISKFDNSGNYITSKIIGGEGFDELLDSYVSKSGEIHLFGTMDYFHFPGTRWTNSKAIYLKTDVNLSNFTNTVSSNFIKEDESAIKIYPNPNLGKMQFEIPFHFERFKIELYDVTGKLVLEREMTIQKQTLDTSIIPEGFYFAKLSFSNRKPFVQRVMITN